LVAGDPVNFVQSEFWLQLLGFGLPLLGLRAIAQPMGLWKSVGDRLSLLLLSLVLFWSLSPLSFIILCFEGVVSYGIIQIFLATPMAQKKSLSTKLLLAIGTIGLLSILAYFKYFKLPQFLEIIPLFSGILATSKVGLVAPGLSFHTFQMISAMVDAYQDRLTQPIKKIDYANFVFLFPQAVSGPIERWNQLGTKLTTFQFSFQYLEKGLCWMSLGLFMKLVLADNLMRYSQSPIADIKSAWCIWLYVWLYGMRLYFDFAGYSFVALGLGKSIGIDLEINFLSPYSATTIKDFWRRWNVTLSTWFRDYLFIPLGGNRVRWNLLNLLIVFLASGVWHGSSINFILWGFYHGILLVIHQVWETWFSRYLKISSFFSWLLTLTAVLLGWVFFVESNLGRLSQIMITLTSLSSYRFDNLIYEWAMLQMISPFFLFFTIGLSTLILGLEFYTENSLKEMPYTQLIKPRIAVLLLGLIIMLASRDPGQFIYFSF
jgi:alginate O-acetyltransferase complex protein AlgI